MKNLGFIVAGIVLILVVSLLTFNLADKELVLNEAGTGEVKTYTITFPLSEMLHSHGAHAMDPDGPTSQWQYYTEKAPQNMAVTKIGTVVENAPDEIIHHLSLGSLGVPSIICAENTHKNYREYYTLSRTNTHQDLVFPAPYSLQIHEGEDLSLEVMTHVLDEPFGPGGHYEDAVVKIEMEYTDFESRPSPLAFVRLRLDDTPCADPIKHQAYLVPANSGSHRRESNIIDGEGESYVFPTSGVVLARSGNVWGAKGGKYMRAFINGDLLDDLQPYQGEEDWQWYIDYVSDPVRVEAGDLVTLEGGYENNTDMDIKDASGMYGFYFAPDLE